MEKGEIIILTELLGDLQKAFDNLLDIEIAYSLERPIELIRIRLHAAGEEV